MGDWNLGSVATEVLLFIDNIPDNVSGALPGIADRQREYVECYTGATIGSNSINIKYQEAILQLTIAKITKDMLSIGVDGNEVVLGDFKIKTGADSNLSSVYRNSYMAAKEELRCLGRKINYFKANG